MTSPQPGRITVRFPKPSEQPAQPVPLTKRLGALGWATVTLIVGVIALAVVSALFLIGDQVPYVVTTLAIGAVWAGFLMVRGILDREYTERRIAESESRTHALLAAELQGVHDHLARAVADIRAYTTKIRTEVCANVDTMPLRVYTYAEAANAVINDQADAALAEGGREDAARLLRTTPSRGAHILRPVPQRGSRD